MRVPVAFPLSNTPLFCRRWQNSCSPLVTRPCASLQVIPPLPFQNPACVFCRSFTGLQTFALVVFQRGASRSRVSSAGGLFPPVYFFYHFLSGKKTRTYKKETPESRMNRAFQRVSSLLSDANNYFTSDNVHYVKSHYFIISFYLSHTANPCPVCVCDTFG